MRPASQRLLRSPSEGPFRHTRELRVALHFCPQILYGCQAYNYGPRATFSSGNSTESCTVEDDAKLPRGLIRKQFSDRITKHDNRTKIANWREHSAVIRKIDNREKIGDWRQRLVTFEQYQYESDLGKPVPDGSFTRLVDSSNYCMDFSLWLELLRFRRRHYGLDGLRVIWKEISRRGLQLPCQGAKADELWSSLLQLGFQFPKILKEIEIYAKKQRVLTGSSWPGLYLMILSYHLKLKPNHAYQWHAHLHTDFPPSVEQVAELFRQAVMNEAALGYFRRLYIELGIRSMYDIIIPAFCDREDYDSALKWHNLLIRKRDLPSDASISEPLLHHLAVYGKPDHLVEITKEMVDAGVSYAQRTRSTYKRIPFISRELMNRQLGESHGVAPKVFSDEFCARLFATTMFTIDIVINGLCVLGVEAIGPLSLRELGSREKSKPRAISSRIDQLISAGISIGNSTFSTLVRRLALEEKSDLLKDVLTCDLHPDAFEDCNLQESLLVSYHQAGHRRQMDRTLAILTVNSPHRTLATDHWNLLLRVYLTRRDLKGIQLTLETMRDMHLMVSSRSSSYVRLSMLSRRQTGKLPYRSDDLPLVINIWRLILRLGGMVPLTAWREVLKRLGMTGQLKHFEALSLWLANWYSNPAARASEVSLTSPDLEDREKPRSQVPVTLSPRHRLHPLRILFPTVMQKAIVTWGFQRRVIGQISMGSSSSRWIDKQSWTWGLHLLRKLSQCKVVIARPTVISICRQRLVALFGHGLSKRKINRQARQVNTHRLGQYLNQVHEIWAIDLSDEANRMPINPQYRRLLSKHRIRSKRMLRTSQGT